MRGGLHGGMKHAKRNGKKHMPPHSVVELFFYLALQRHLAHGLLYMPLRDVVIAHSSRPPWDLILPWEFPSLTCQPL